LQYLGCVVAYLFALLVCTGCRSVREYGCDEIISVSTSEDEQSESHYRKGVRLFDHGKLPAAAEAFQNAIRADFQNGSAHNNLGLVYYEQKKWPEAAAEFETATRLLAQDGTPWNNLGMTMEATGQGYEAIECYQQAYELNPRKALYLGNLVRTRIRLGESDESVIEQLKELLFIESRPDWIEWANDQLALKLNPQLDRGPPPPNLSSTKKALPRPDSPALQPLQPVLENPTSELIIAEPIVPSR
jgi:tetratricopeptide (TPR) repeat protein